MFGLKGYQKKASKDCIRRDRATLYKSSVKASNAIFNKLKSKLTDLLHIELFKFLQIVINLTKNWIKQINQVLTAI